MDLLLSVLVPIINGLYWASPALLAATIIIFRRTVRYRRRADAIYAEAEEMRDQARRLTLADLALPACGNPTVLDGINCSMARGHRGGCLVSPSEVAERYHPTPF